MNLAVSERDFQSAVLDLAAFHGWHRHHTLPARTAKGWATPLAGDAGLPDLVLARGGRVLLAELKAERGRATEGQIRWLAALGDHGRLWRPSDWTEIVETLGGAV